MKNRSILNINTLNDSKPRPPGLLEIWGHRLVMDIITTIQLLLSTISTNGRKMVANINEAAGSRLFID